MNFFPFSFLVLKNSGSFPLLWSFLFPPAFFFFFFLMPSFPQLQSPRHTLAHEAASPLLSIFGVTSAHFILSALWNIVSKKASFLLTFPISVHCRQHIKCFLKFAFVALLVWGVKYPECLMENHPELVGERKQARAVLPWWWGRGALKRKLIRKKE